MSFTTEVKQEVALKQMNGGDARAELSALIQMTSSLSLSNRGMTIVVRIENPTVAKTIYRMVKSRYQVDIDLAVQRKMNLRKNNIYLLRILSGATQILQDLGIYSARGLLNRPLQKIVQAESNARAYLAGLFLAAGSVNSPQNSNYHLELKTGSQEQAQFVIQLLARFYIPARSIQRRGKEIVYVKAAEKIADFLRCIEAYDSLMKFENIRISRDFSNSITRLNNCDVANEIKSQQAAADQLQDIAVLQENDRFRFLDERLLSVIQLRQQNPECSLNELCSLYEKQTGKPVSKSGMKHRFVRIHELAQKEKSDDSRR